VEQLDHRGAVKNLIIAGRKFEAALQIQQPIAEAAEFVQRFSTVQVKKSTHRIAAIEIDGPIEACNRFLAPILVPQCNATLELSFRHVGPA
jgi:hypothetical protein